MGKNNGDQVTEVKEIESEESLEIFNRVKTLESRLEQIRTISLKLTRESDWVLFGDSLHMTAMAAENLAVMLGISWPRYDSYGNTLLSSERIDIGEGHYMWVFTGEFHWEGRAITVEGHQASNTPFHTSSGKKEAEEVNEKNVRSHSYSNMILNGVRRITGLHNVTLEDLAKAGKDVSLVKQVDFVTDSKKQKLDGTDHAYLKIIDEILAIKFSGKSTEARAEWLKKETAFKDVPGVTELKKLSKGRIKFLHGKVVADLWNGLMKMAKEIDKKKPGDLLKTVTTYTESTSGEIIPGSNQHKELSAQQMIKGYNTLLDMLAQKETKAAEKSTEKNEPKTVDAN